jgi:CheY-like chemotaxis protein
MERMANQFVSSQAAAGAAEVIGHLVLVAEDHADSRLMLKTMLELNGARVVEAGDGEAAVRVAVSERPDLILMDLNLPQMDGLAALRRIRESDGLGQTPVVIMTGHSGDDYRAAALGAGSAGFLVKPISYQDFHRTLKRCLPRANPGSGTGHERQT